MVELIQIILTQYIDEELVEIAPFHFLIGGNSLEIFVDVLFFLVQYFFEEEISKVHRIHSFKIKIRRVLFFVQPIVK